MNKKLSIFIDESGHFGFNNINSKYYVFTLVFHDQSDDLSSIFAESELYLSRNGFSNHNIHTGQLVRGKDDYEGIEKQIRVRLFNHLMRLFRDSNVRFKSFIYEKKSPLDTKEKLLFRMTRDLTIFIKENHGYLSKFDQTIVYYDNGQSEIKALIDVVMYAEFSNICQMQILPANKKLFQVADLICTLELLAVKFNMKSLTKSDRNFFGSGELLNKNYLKKLDKFRFEK